VTSPAARYREVASRLAVERSYQPDLERQVNALLILLAKKWCGPAERDTSGGEQTPERASLESEHASAKRAGRGAYTRADKSDDRFSAACRIAQLTAGREPTLPPVIPERSRAAQLEARRRLWRTLLPPGAEGEQAADAAETLAARGDERDARAPDDS
jgi:hypothetical protein